MEHGISIVRPAGFSTAAGPGGPDRLGLEVRFATQRGQRYAPGEAIVVFRGGFNAAQLSAKLRARGYAAAAMEAPSGLAAVLRASKARSLDPLFGRLSATRAFASALPLRQAYRLRFAAESPEALARSLRALPDVAYASPDYYVASLATEPHAFSERERERARHMAEALRYAPAHVETIPRAASTVALPTNYALQSSLESYLNDNALDVVPAYEALEERYGQLPGQGEIVTNVSLGDLTDESMARKGDAYVQLYGPTTRVSGGQRYLDIPSFPLIPTFTSDASGKLNPLGSVEGVDPYLSEVLLDFSVMAPLPDSLQRPGETGSGLSDLLGIAPGATYRLVVPQQPTISDVEIALLAAAAQTPHPDVITASVGFGTDTVGFPGRYLEEDPLAQSLIDAIVSEYGIVVCIAANDGTRLYTNAAVNPDGGSTPTLTGARGATTIADDSLSTIPGVVEDSGAIAAGGATLDDIFVAPPQTPGRLNGNTAFPETRLDGATDFSSGFGTRIDLSAPSDNIPSLVHPCACGASPSPSTVEPVLEGGTSASSPEIAAAAAVVLQAARLAGKPLNPAQLRALLERTARPLPNPPQLDTNVDVGPQLDLGAAVAEVLGKTSAGSPRVLRVAIAQRQELGDLGGEFEENTDPSNIDLAGPDFGSTPSGQNQVSPITIAPDWFAVPPNAKFALYVTGHRNRRLAQTAWARLMPASILQAAGDPFVSENPRTVSLTYAAMLGNRVLAQATFSLIFAANTGTYAESLAPIAPPSVALGKSVAVRYDLSHVANLVSPQLLVSSIGHWSPVAAPYFRIAYSTPLTVPKGSVTIPARVFASGAGVYGIGIEMNSTLKIVGRFTPLRVSASSTNRPPAPTLSRLRSGSQAHTLAVSRADPTFVVHYDVAGTRGATGAMLELSAPGPTVSALENVFENAFGSTRDDNGIDTASVVYEPLDGTKGAVELSAAKLGLTSSLVYNVRVLPASGKNIVGEASPVSTLEFDDTIAPGGAYVDAFDIVPGGSSAVSTLSTDANGSLTESAIYSYSPSNERYGIPLIDDATGANEYYVIGQDPSLSQVAAVDYARPNPSGNVQDFLTLNARSGQVLANLPLAGGTAEILTGRVDAQRHRAAILQYEFGTTGSTVLPIDLTTDTAGTAIGVGTRSFARAGQPNLIDLDPSSGLFYLSAENVGTNCVISASGVESLDVGSGTLSSVAALPACVAGLASDRLGGALYLAKGMLSSYGPGIAPFVSSLLDVTDNPLQLAGSFTLSDRACFMPAVDPVARLTLVACIVPKDYLVNNAAMSVIDVFDQSSQTVVKRIPAFDFAYPASSGIPFVDRGIQVDPATRTGWTFAPDGTAVQQFAY